MAGRKQTTVYTSCQNMTAMMRNRNGEIQESDQDVHFSNEGMAKQNRRGINEQSDSRFSGAVARIHLPITLCLSCRRLGRQGSAKSEDEGGGSRLTSIDIHWGMTPVYRERNEATHCWNDVVLIPFSIFSLRPTMTNWSRTGEE
jgi:hypothetical protein